ncbi:MAG TPA: GNAT family N-acetyltransferase, partial [Streptosporangiaceae bacterium]
MTGGGTACGHAPDLVVRTARAADLDRILDLLTHYDRPRSFFEPWYLADPAYRPQHSWLAEEDGRLVAHLRLFPRMLRIGGPHLRVAGLGNIVTAREARGRGHAGRLIQASLGAAARAGYQYSLLWTHLPQVYQRYGFGPAPEQELHAAAGPSRGAAGIRLADDADLPAIAALQDTFDARRSGPAVRDLAWWRASRHWLGDDLLVAGGPAGITGYARRRIGPDLVEVLELGVDPGDIVGGRQLLAAAAAPRQGRFRAVLPRSLYPVVDPLHRAIRQSPGLMGRPLALPDLAAVLSGMWAPRLAAARLPGGTVPVALPGQAAALRVTPGGVTASADPGDALPLGPGELTALLFRGCDNQTIPLVGKRPDLNLLATVAP